MSIQALRNSVNWAVKQYHKAEHQFTQLVPFPHSMTVMAIFSKIILAPMAKAQLERSYSNCSEQNASPVCSNMRALPQLTEVAANLFLIVSIYMSLTHISSERSKNAIPTHTSDRDEPESPKGREVFMPIRALRNSVNWAVQQYHKAEDRFAQLVPFPHSMTVMAIFSKIILAPMAKAQLERAFANTNHPCSEQDLPLLCSSMRAMPQLFDIAMDVFLGACISMSLTHMFTERPKVETPAHTFDEDDPTRPKE